MNLFSSLILFLLVITIDTSPGRRRDETQVKKPCTKPGKTRPVEIITTTTTTTTKPKIVIPIGKKPCNSKISKECKKVNIGTDSHPQYRQKCRKVKVDSVTKEKTVLGDWEYDEPLDNDAVENTSSAEEKSTGNGNGSEQCEQVNVGSKKHPKYRKRCRKVKVDSVTKRKTDVGKWEYVDDDEDENSGDIETTSNPDGSQKQCKKVNVGTKSNPKYRKKCRKVKVNSVTKKTTVLGDWEYEDDDSDETDGTNKQPDNSDENGDIVQGSDGSSKQCKNVNVGTKAHPKYRKKCRKVKVDSKTDKTTVVGDWEYEDDDDENQGKNQNQSSDSDEISKQCKNVNVGTKSHPKYRKKCRKVKVDSKTDKTTVVGDWQYEDEDSGETGTSRGDNDSDENQTTRKPTSGSSDGSGGISKQCEKVKLGSKSHPIYRKKCRKVKVDSKTDETTVLGDWEYEDDNDDEKPPIGEVDDDDGGFVKVENPPQTSGTPSSSNSGEIQKQCEKVNVGSKKLPKYRKRCRKVKVDSKTDKTTVVGDWEYEDDDSDQSSSGEASGSSGQENSNENGDNSSKKNETQKQCEKVNVGTKSQPKYRKRCRSVKINKTTDKTTEVGDWQFDDDDDDDDGGVITNAHPDGKENGISKQCEKVNVGTKSHPKYRKRCRKVKVDSKTKKTTVVGDWEYEDDDSDQSSSGETSGRSGQENSNENGDSGEIQRTTQSPKSTRRPTDSSDENVDIIPGSGGYSKQCKNVNVGTKSHPKYRKRCRKVKVDSKTDKTTVLGDWEYEDDDSDETGKRSGSQGSGDNDSDRFIIQKQCAKMNVGTKEHPLLRNKCRKVKIDRVTKKTTVIGDWEYKDDDDDNEESDNSYDDDEEVSSEPRTHTASEGDGHSERKVVCENVNVGTADHPKMRKRCRNEETIRITERNTTTTEWDYDDKQSQTQTKTSLKSKFSRKSRLPDTEEYDDDEYQSEESEKKPRKLSESYDDDQDNGYDDEEYYDDDNEDQDEDDKWKIVRKTEKRRPMDSYSTDYYSYEVY